ncbi:hypothetical protein KEM48_009926 [Puccinia striiformis f. sp. tritici PST-130]|nr:hypothetical protein KEM48_009926 [Puccinia striiformis f. sp. tritici PST-130]
MLTQPHRIGDEIDIQNGIFSQGILTNDFWNNASELDQIGNEVKGRNNFFSYKTLGSNFWKVARKAEGKESGTKLKKL